MPSNVDKLYTYVEAPMITGISPTTAMESEQVTITGTGFDGNAVVKFNGTPALGVNYANVPFRLVATVPLVPGTYALTVTNPDSGYKATSQLFTFKWPSPVITSTDISQGVMGNTVTVYGSGFQSGAKVYFDGNRTTGVEATTTTWVSEGVLQVVVPPGIGKVSLTVWNPDGQDCTEPDLFTYKPIVSSVSPSSGPAAGGTAVTITGRGFMQSPTVRFAAVMATSPAVPTLTGTLSFNGSTTVTGAGTSFTTQLAAGDFIKLSSGGVWRRVASIQSTTSLTLARPSGYSGSGAAICDRKVTAVTPAGTGTVDVTVTNSVGGTGVKTGGFTYP